MNGLKNAYGKAPALFSLILCVAVILTSAAVYFAIGLFPRNAQKFDVTENGLYTLQPETLSFLNELDRDVEIILISETGVPEYGTPETLLRSYAEKNEHIKLTVAPPDEYFAKYGTLTEGCAIIKSEYRETLVYSSDYFDVSQEYFYRTLNIYNELSTQLYQQYGISTYADFMYSGLAEYLGLFDIARYQNTLTNAIRYVASDDVITLYAATVKDETTISNYLYPELRQYNIELIFGKLSDGIPENADGVLINNPTTDITEDDKKILTEYLAKGGKLTLITSYLNIGNLPNLLSICEEYGLTTDGGLLCEDDKNYNYNGTVEATYPTVNTEVLNGYLKSEELKPLVMGGTGITVTEKEGITAISLLDTSENAYCRIENEESSETESSSSEATAATDTDADSVVRNKYSTAAIAKNNLNGSSILWFPTFALSDSMCDTYSERNNFPVFTATLGVQYGSEKPIVIPGVSIISTPLDVPDSAFPAGIAIAIAVPCLILAIGGLRVVKRRKHKS